MNGVDVAIVGTGWCGGIRTEACAANPLVSGIHIAETNSERRAEVAAKAGARSATSDYRDLLGNKEISAVFVCATPETTHFPMARDFLRAGKRDPIDVSLVNCSPNSVDGGAPISEFFY